MWIALISAVATAAGLVTDKIALSRERLSLRVYLPLVFTFLCAFTLLLAPISARINFEIALLSNQLFLLFLMVIMAIAWNVLFYQSVKKERMYEHEMITMTAPLITIVLAAMFFPNERDPQIFTLALVASAALFIARREKRAKFILDRDGYNLLLGVILMSAENIIFRELLYSYTPVALYAIRTFILACFFMAYYAPRYKQVSTRHYWLIAGSAFLGVIGMITKLYAFAEIGVIYTTLISMLAPLLVLFASWEIFHERIRARIVVAALVILVVVSWATVLTFA